jgi:hypothetical protein
MDHQQVRVLRSDDVGRRVAVLDDRHFTYAGTDLHRGEYRGFRRADVDVQASRQHDEHMLVLLEG